MESFVHQLNRQIRSKARIPLAVRQGGALDASLVVRLLRHGAFEGAFTEQFILRNGRRQLFFHLAKLLLLQSMGLMPESKRLIVLSCGESDVGLLHLARRDNGVGDQNYLINMVAVYHVYRYQRVATAIIDAMIDLLAFGSTLQAYCNKHSKALEQTLRELCFQREGVSVLGLSLFTYEKIQKARFGASRSKFSSSASSSMRKAE